VSKHFVQSNLLRRAAMAGLRMQARVRGNSALPKVFLVSIPKAGTHLLMGDLERLTGVRRSWVHLNDQDVAARSAAASSTVFGVFDPGAFHARAARVNPGQYFTAHMKWSGPLSEALRTAKCRPVFIYRDPRAVAVSQFHYIKGLERHRLHDLFNELPNDAARYRLLVLGNEGQPYLEPMRERLTNFIGWLRDPSVLSLRFEDLVGDRGGGSDAARSEALARLGAFLGLDESMGQAPSLPHAKPKATFREGKAEAWRKAIPSDAQGLIEKECGDLLAEYGYAAG
jgi:sulfotransferase 6B1